MLVQTLTWTGGFDYKSGTAYKIRNPKDPVSAPGRAKVTTTLGVDGDGFGNCTVTFIQPNTSSAPAPTPGTACIGQAITPTSNVQTTVTNAPTGTTFCFAPGTYNVSITPRAGQIFDGGNRAAIFDGQSTRANAFRASGVANVTIRGFVIKSYRSPLQSAAIQSFGSTGWTIENNHITRNAATAVATDSGAKVLNNLMDHNGQQGYAVHGSGILYEGNEISYNNENLAVDATWEAGGGKAWATKNAVFRSNHVHHNGGHGLWDDTNNIYITYDRNNVHDNWGGGIYHEIGYDATITGNTITNNGTPSSQGGGEDLGWLWDAGILLRASGGLTAASPIKITGNKVTNNYNGIAPLDSPAPNACPNQANSEGAYGPCKIQNVLIENNIVTMSIGGSGVVQDGSSNEVFTSRNVIWRNNDYHVASTNTHPNDGHAYGWFAWNNDWRDWTAWKAYGNDTAGTFGP